MASKLLRVSPYEAENQLELSLRQAFELFEPKLRPPFSLNIPDPNEYSHLNRAILYGILCEPNLAKIHIKHLHAIVTDGYAFFVDLLVMITVELYAKLVDSVRNQLIWVTKVMIDVLGVGFGGLLVSLLRQIVGGDFSDGNLWLCFELVSIFTEKWDLLIEEDPFSLMSGLYVYLRLLAEHCRFSNYPKLEGLRRLEIGFCVKLLREQFHLCIRIGRDLIRLLQDLAHVPEFRAIWKDLLLNPSEFRTQGFSDISNIYAIRTSSRYFLLRITPEMETHLRFLLTHVKLGKQMRHQTWFAKKYICGQEKETLVSDIVRFICCGHYPTNEVIQSDIIPRWAVIGWLLKSCTMNYAEANAKLALFYDWMFFNERVDNIMNIEPAMLLMVYSIPQYVDMTHTCLECLFLLMDNYDAERKSMIVKSVLSALHILVRKGVVHSLDVLTSCNLLSPGLKERLVMSLSVNKDGSSNELRPYLPGYSMPFLRFPDRSVPPLSSTNFSVIENQTSVPQGKPTCTQNNEFSTIRVENYVTISSDMVPSCSASDVITVNHVTAMENLVQNLGEKIKKSYKTGLSNLEEILLLFVNLCHREAEKALISPEVLAGKLSKEIELNERKLFALPDYDNEVGSATNIIVRIFIFSQPKRIQEMLVYWSRNGLRVGAHLLCYASRLAYEASKAGYSRNPLVDNKSVKISDSRMPLLIFHVDGYLSFLNHRENNSSEATASELDGALVMKLVDNAFAAYRSFLMCSTATLQKDKDMCSSKLLFSDLLLCEEWERKRLKFLFSNIFSHLSDLSICEEDIIRFVVDQLNDADLVDMQFGISSKMFSIFGDNTEGILYLIKRSRTWSCVEQHKFWGLIRAELAVSNIQMEKILLAFFCADELDATSNSIATGGLLSLCSSLAPKPELVGAIMLLPTNEFQDFSTAALSTWTMSNPSMLFDSLAKFLGKFDNKNGDSNFLKSTGITLNRSAILWLLSNFNAQGTHGSNILSNLCVDASDIKAMQSS